MPSYRIEKEFIFSKKTEKQIGLFLEQYRGQLNLTDIRDQKGNTAIHQCAFFNQPRLLQKYLSYMQQYLIKTQNNNPTRAMDQFLNYYNADGITALHYAAFKGHYKILEILEKSGADIYAQTKAGQNALHMAAQGDKVQAFIYFQYSLDMNFRDKKKTTPLHWAAFGNSEAVVTYLLAQSHIEINCSDEKQQTPLHFAAAYGNTKIVKRLLKAGAKRQCQNKQRKTALDIAQQSQFRNIVKLLDDSFSPLDKLKLCLNLKTDYRIQKKSPAKPILFILLTVLYLLIRLILLDTLQIIMLYSEIGLYSLMILLYISLSFSSPPKPLSKTYTYYLNTLPNIPLKHICLICIQEKPYRSSHCDICRVCVARYDHHCYWINNCVGRYNHNRFLAFIILFLTYLIYLGFFGGCIIYNLYSGQVFIFKYKEDRPQFLRTPILYIYTVMAIAVFLIFFIPMLLLVCVQMKNVFMNKTTYERFTKDKLSSFTQSNSHIISEQIELNHYRQKKRKWSLINAKQMICSNEETELTFREINNSSLTDSLVA